ncbi:LacI family DNA-binding transcriptional regulator [Nocardioides sp. LS1]|uniref:LacI family DNA-binding transcriptional regulator n=1 Tax=Nocardioides sp. LS1 TaxID=1027620 RepID=UPI001C8B4990|nr:LacI family DNA-binding transcriptional regulator [Nocardioides sp. LS1]
MVTTKKVTLTDVAERAGVSTTTASYILNGRSAEMRISADAERRVREAVAHLGYRPNRNARSLRTRTTSTFGVISDFVASGHFASQMLAGASAAARASEHLLVIGETQGDPALEHLLIEEMLDRQVDGIVYATLTSLEVRVPAELKRLRTVLLNCIDPTTSIPAVLPDEYAGGRTAAGVLLDAGVTGEIHVIGEDPTPNALAGPGRLEGIRTRLAEAGRSVTSVVPCHWGVEDAYEAVDAWLRRGARPAGLLCLNDRIAMGVYQALAGNGLHVPRDVSIVSFDGSELATWLRPRVVSVALPFSELGARAVQALVDPGWADVGTVRLPMPLAPGGSVRSPAVGSRG